MGGGAESSDMAETMAENQVWWLEKGLGMADESMWTMYVSADCAE